MNAHHTSSIAICPPCPAPIHAMAGLDGHLSTDEQCQGAMAAFDAACERGDAPEERQALLRQAMLRTPHGQLSNALEHGEDIAQRFEALRAQLQDQQSPEEKSLAPDWLQGHGQHLMDLALAQADAQTMSEYLTHHDCGKPATMQRDAVGRLHFPGHAQASADTWARAGGSEMACRLMSLDMVLHTVSAEEAKAFAQSEPLAPALLLAAWCEIESNAISVFGGRESTSYKIKRKALERRARAIISAIALG